MVACQKPQRRWSARSLSSHETQGCLIQESLYWVVAGLT